MLLYLRVTNRTFIHIYCGSVRTIHWKVFERQWPVSLLENY